EGLDRPALVRPDGLGLEQLDDLRVALAPVECTQAGRGPMEVPAPTPVGPERHPRGAKQPVGPDRGNLLRCAEVAPVVGERLDVRHLVRRVRLPAPLEPRFPGPGVHRCNGDERDQLGDGTVDGRADGARGAVDVFERWRQPLEEADGAVGGKQGVFAGDLLDLADGLLHALDGGLRLPSERAPSKVRLERPPMGFAPAHQAHQGVVAGGAGSGAAAWSRCAIPLSTATSVDAVSGGAVITRPPPDVRCTVTPAKSRSTPGTKGSGAAPDASRD